MPILSPRLQVELLGQQIFAYYKRFASLSHLGKYFLRKKSDMKLLLPNNPKNDKVQQLKTDLILDYRFKSLFQNRNVHLLGRSIDLNRLISQRIDRLIGESLMYAIDHFTSGDIARVMVERMQSSINYLYSKLNVS